MRRRRIAPARVKVEGEKGRVVLQARLATGAALTPDRRTREFSALPGPILSSREGNDSSESCRRQRGLSRSMA